MLETLKKYKTAILAGVLALVYLIGIKRGKDNEKAYQNKKVLENVGVAGKVRRSLNNSDTTRKLHNKYKR